MQHFAHFPVEGSGTGGWGGQEGGDETAGSNRRWTWNRIRCSYERCDRTPVGPGGILRRLPDISVCMGCIKKKQKENSAPAHLLFPQQVRPEALAAKAILLGWPPVLL